MFILSIIHNTYNGFIRGSRKNRKGKACREKTRGIESIFRASKVRGSCLRECRRLGKSNEQIRSKDKQCTFSNQARTRIRVYLSLIPLFLFYNPYILISIIYIDMLFADELIYINIIQINSIIDNIQRFNNIGVV